MLTEERLKEIEHYLSFRNHNGVMPIMCKELLHDNCVLRRALELAATSDGAHSDGSWGNSPEEWIEQAEEEINGQE